MARRGVVISGTVAAALGIAALATWLSLGLVTVGSTSVVADVTAIQCRTGDTGRVNNARSVIVTRDLDCDLRFVVTNNGPVPVWIDMVTLRFLGPESGMPVRALQSDDSSGIDARITSGDIVLPGTSLFLTIPIESGTGCLAENGSMSPRALPLLSIRALGIPADVQPPFAQVAFEGTGCL